jgi:hypothetical protein
VYVRDLPEQYNRVNWIFQLDESTLRAELENCGLDIAGSKEELALRLFKYFRDHLEEFLEFPLELGDICHNKELHRPFPLDTVRKWGLKFTPGDSVYFFLERLGELKSAYEVGDKAMLRAVPELLKGQVLLWFRNNQSTWVTWEDFLISIKDRYLPVDIDDVLMEEIRLRTQGVGESVADYLTAVRTLMRRLAKELTASELRLLMKNLRPEVRLYIRDCDADSTVQLFAMGKQYERFKREKERFKPPPDIAQALIPEVAYRARKLGVVKKPSLLNPALESDPSEADTPCETRHPTSLARRNKPLCWNCNKPGHFFSQCKQSKRVFCRMCGRPNRRTTTCDGRGRRTADPPLAESPCRRRQASAVTSRQRLRTRSRKAREYQKKE